ncbi:transcriptional regulator, GntR family with UTRA sensor domain [Emticicia oligotrophica DSM 17448]|uniref:Transcriptional regulator, GntR family with UTRA sensor domain n=1 Tax=Emticicia oligotrophica (strain DSM 17448 / CIP 109782 / MTCC 6937 / GPTSA100-15) TaxID=929562 RepID=A0ABM5MZQ3_EMTOG|nr:MULTISPECIES: GntR family transcriptional regulator [Emticicia]AFK02474.1 transcriptional regulator, GntR family with UTRA sensor domain [Emticicia oligotrophica DSM 17448]
MKTPLYRQIQANLKEKITSGIYEEGGLLPSENDLCSEFSATRMTVRQALNELVREGYITRQHGKGSIVSASRKSLGLLSLKGWTEVVVASDRHGKTLVLEGPVLKPLDDMIFMPLLEGEAKDDFIFFKRLRLVEDSPVMFEQTYIPNKNLPNFIEEPLLEGSLFRTLLIRYHVDVQSMSQEVRAIAADKETASLLKIKQKSPVLHLLRKYKTSVEGFFLYSSIYCNTEKFAISSFN